MKPNSEPLITVILPVHNRGDQVLDAIRSVQNQSFETWELVIIDDGSTDQTLHVIRQAAYHDQRITTLFHPHRMNLGPGASRNLGIAAAHGDVIAFLDSDDVLEPDALGTFWQVLEGFPEVPVVYGRARICGDRGDGTMIGAGLPGVPADLFPQLVRNNVIATGSIAIRRKVLGPSPFPSEMPSAQDWACWLRLSADHPFVFIDRVLLTVRTCGAGITGRGIATVRARSRYTRNQVNFLRRCLRSVPVSRRDFVSDGLRWRSAECFLRAVFSGRHGRFGEAYHWLTTWLAVAKGPLLMAQSIGVAMKTLGRFRKGAEMPSFIRPFASEHGDHGQTTASTEVTQ